MPEKLSTKIIYFSKEVAKELDIPVHTVWAYGRHVKLQKMGGQYIFTREMIEKMRKELKR